MATATTSVDRMASLSSRAICGLQDSWEAVSGYWQWRITLCNMVNRAASDRRLKVRCVCFKVITLYTPATQVADRQQLRSASRRLLVVPRIPLDMYGRRAFAVVGPTIWNALGNDLRGPDLSIASFGRLLKTHLFQQYLMRRAH